MDYPARPGSWTDALFLASLLSMILFFTLFISAKIASMRDSAFATKTYAERAEQQRIRLCAEWVADFGRDASQGHAWYRENCLGRPGEPRR